MSVSTHLLPHQIGQEGLNNRVFHVVDHSRLSMNSAEKATLFPWPPLHKSRIVRFTDDLRRRRFLNGLAVALVDAASCRAVGLGYESNRALDLVPVARNRALLRPRSSTPA